MVMLIERIATYYKKLKERKRLAEIVKKKSNMKTAMKVING